MHPRACRNNDHSARINLGLQDAKTSRFAPLEKLRYFLTAALTAALGMTVLAAFPAGDAGGAPADRHGRPPAGQGGGPGPAGFGRGGGPQFQHGAPFRAPGRDFGNAARGPHEQAGHDLARGPDGGRAFGSHTFGNHTFGNRTFGARQPGGTFGRDRFGGGRNFGGNFERRRGGDLLARNGLPPRPFFGEPGFTGVPPQGETRFISRELIVHVGSDVSPQTLDAAARRLGLVSIGQQNILVTGGTLVHFRVDGGRDVADAVRAFEAEKIGLAQPNYLFSLQQDPSAAAPGGARLDQYVAGKLHLADAHRIATGNNVLIAVIDSKIDVAHPDLAGSVVGQFDAVGAPDQPDEHGTGMTGAIAAHRKLLGVAPRARILAIHAFSPNQDLPQQATTQSIVAGIDWAIEKGARIINMSFAGPYDPLLQLALKKAHDKGIVLIAAAGNMGPQSPPLYPAADENVIAVTAVDQDDKLLPQANQGAYVAIAAPGVKVIEAAPRGAYNYTTGTSVAAAHVSGAAALLIERNPAIDVASVENALLSTARDLGKPGRDSEFGYGLVDPYRALTSLDDKIASGSPPSAPSGRPNTGPVAETATPLPVAPAAFPAGTPTLPAGTLPAGPGARVAGSTASVRGDVASPTMPVRGPEPGPAGPAATPRPDLISTTPAEPQIMERRRAVCRQDGLNKGVRPAEMLDYQMICVAEAQLGCLKQAVAQKLRGTERRDFMNRCLLGQ